MHIQIPIILTLATIFAIPAVASAEPNHRLITGSEDDDILIGSEQDDRIIGSDGNDVLRGEAGDDILLGGTGMDYLYGGLGADTFVIDLATEGTDTIRDYDESEGDEVYLDAPAYTRHRYKLPDKLTVGNLHINKRGNVSIKLNGDDNHPIFNIKNSNLILKVEDDGNRVRLVFKNRM